MPVSQPFTAPVQVNPRTAQLMKEAGYTLEYDKLNMPTWIKAPTVAGVPTAAPGTTPSTEPGAVTDPMAMYRQALERLSGGGAMLESSLADIEAGKKEAIGAGQQALVSSGIAGTTMMGGVPIQAEKGAGRARLAARGQVEQLRLQTLASYAGLAQQAKLASAERQAAQQRLQTQLTAQTKQTTAAREAETKRIRQLATEQRRAQTSAEMAAKGRGGFMLGMGEGTAFAPARSSWMAGGGFDYSGFTNIASGGSGGGQEPYSYGAHLTPSIPRTMTSMGPTTSYAQQFPTTYGQEEEPVPQWM